MERFGIEGKIFFLREYTQKHMLSIVFAKYYNCFAKELKSFANEFFEKVVVSVQ